MHFLAPPSSLTLSLPPVNSMSSSASLISPDSTVLPPSRAMLACATRRISSLMKAALTPSVRCAASPTTASLERQAPAIELDQLAAADVVRQRHLDRLVDAAGPARQRALKLLRPVGGENEQDIRILLQPVHLVEKLVEHRFVARPHLVAIARNEIDVLDHDHRRLQQAGEAHVLRKQCDLRGGDDQGSVTGQIAGQIADGVGLAGAGRPVEQDALARRLPEPAQLLAALHKVQHVAIEQLQCGFGQDRRPRAEPAAICGP